MTDPLRETARGFAAALPASVEMPAGAGKTHLLSATVRELTEDGGRVLVLTHTNAGVHAIQKRLADFGVATRYRVSTITSFAFTLARAYPDLAEVRVPAIPNWSDSTIYIEAASRGSGSRHIREVLRSSFSHMLVDEYQDCSRSHHRLVTTLTDAIPTTGILGDPMQAIFGFADPLIPWAEVQEPFPDHDVPRLPWRWVGHNEALGAWLIDCREFLVPGFELDLSHGLPNGVSFRLSAADGQALRAACRTTGAAGDSVLVISGIRQEQTRATAAKLGGMYSTMEEIGGSFMQGHLAKLAECAPGDYADWLAGFIKASFCGHAGLDGPVRSKLSKGRTVSHYNREGLDEAMEALDRVVADPTLATLAAAMSTVGQAPALSLHSHEAWSEVQTAIRGAVAGGGQSELLLGELAKARDRIRHAGRSRRRRVVSRTLLVKGLEYDHVVIANASEVADACNLYVALSRARKTVTILGASPKLIVAETRIEPKLKKSK